MRSSLVLLTIVAAGCVTDARPERVSYPAQEVVLSTPREAPAEPAPAPAPTQPIPAAPVDRRDLIAPAMDPAPFELEEGGVVGGVISSVPGGTPTSSPGSSPGSATDLARQARLLGSTSWNCPFPAEADKEQVDRAAVMLLVEVALDGTARSVRILKDPGHGFGRAARECALGKKYDPARDGTGAPIVGKTPPIVVRFQR